MQGGSSAQQAYNNASGYTCPANNSSSSSCSATILYRTQTLNEKLTNVGTLFNATVKAIANLSNIKQFSGSLGFATPLYIPITCRCLNGTYQAPVSRLITNGDTFFTIANKYEGLTTVQAIQAANPNQVSTNLMIGTNITIPLRCACPAASAAQQQTDHEITNFFLTFVVFPGETLDVISSYSNAYIPDLEAANKVNAHTTLETYTTFLVPLANLPPLSLINFKTPRRLLSNKTHTPSPAPTHSAPSPTPVASRVHPPAPTHPAPSPTPVASPVHSPAPTHPAPSPTPVASPVHPPAPTHPAPSPTPVASPVHSPAPTHPAPSPTPVASPVHSPAPTHPAPSPTPVAAPGVPSGNESSPASSNRKFYIALGIGISTSLVAVSLLAIFLILACKKKWDPKNGHGVPELESEIGEMLTNNRGDTMVSSDGFQKDVMLARMSDMVGSDKPLVFSYEELQEATMNFSDGKRIQGSVFWGKVRGKLVVIKQMKGNMTESELKILTEVHHANLVTISIACSKVHVFKLHHKLSIKTNLA
jgi:hypothetical protein